ncbi:hypothetical protein D3C76_1741870 [compost metagenome]
MIAPVSNRQGLLGNPYVLRAIAACIPLQLLFTHAPIMQEIFGSTDLTLQEWGKVIGAGLLVYLVVELEKWVIRNTRLAERLSLAASD